LNPSGGDTVHRNRARPNLIGVFFDLVAGGNTIRAKGSQPVRCVGVVRPEERLHTATVKLGGLIG